MGQFLKKTTCFLFPLLILVIGINFYGDAGNLYSKDYETKIGEEIIRGHNVTNVLNCDERVLQKYCINNLQVCPDILAIGSSRMMMVHASLFKGTTFYNASVSGAAVEDLLAITSMYDQKNCSPRKIFIGLDPWTLNRNSTQTRWRVLNSDLKKFLSNSNDSGNLPDEENMKERFKSTLRANLKYNQLISPSYFQQSLYSVFFLNTTLLVTTQKDNITLTRLSDGSISYDAKTREIPPKELEKKVADFTRDGIYGIENFTDLDSDDQKKLDLLITYYKQRKTEIIFILAPYHPDIYKKIATSSKYIMVSESEKYFKELADKNHIKIKGSFDPGKIGLTSKDFYDGMHCT